MFCKKKKGGPILHYGWWILVNNCATIVFFLSYSFLNLTFTFTFEPIWMEYPFGQSESMWEGMKNIITCPQSGTSSSIILLSKHSIQFLETYVVQVCF